jgi:hypothetical protein
LFHILAFNFNDPSSRIILPFFSAFYHVLFFFLLAREGALNKTKDFEGENKIQISTTKNEFNETAKLFNFFKTSRFQLKFFQA